MIMTMPTQADGYDRLASTIAEENYRKECDTLHAMMRAAPLSRKNADTLLRCIREGKIPGVNAERRGS
jgi:hypothetical protein